MKRYLFGFKGIFLGVVLISEFKAKCSRRRGPRADFSIQVFTYNFLNVQEKKGGIVFLSLIYKNNMRKVFLTLVLTLSNLIPSKLTPMMTLPGRFLLLRDLQGGKKVVPQRGKALHMFRYCPLASSWETALCLACSLSIKFSHSCGLLEAKSAFGMKFWMSLLLLFFFGVT